MKASTKAVLALCLFLAFPLYLTSQAAAQGTSTVTGTITGVTGPTGVTVTLSGANNASVTAGTDANGAYSFTGLTIGTYTVTPSLSGYTFTPPSAQATITADNQTVAGIDFTATAISPETTTTIEQATTTTTEQATTVPPSTFSISGTVTCNGNPFPGVTMTLSGGDNASAVTTQTNDSGEYAFSGLKNGTYTVTPSYPDRSFTPESRQVTISGASVTGIDFAKATAATTTICQATTTISEATTTVIPETTTTIPTVSGFTVSGFVTLSDSGKGLAGVTVTLSSASDNETGGDNETGEGTASVLMTATTNDIGCFTFSGVANGTYTVTPSLSGYTFEPPSKQVTVSDADVTGVDFTATAVQPATTTIISETTTTVPPVSGFTISGTVTLSGAGLAGVTVTLTNSVTRTVVTDSKGKFEFTGLADNGTFIVTPSLTGYAFTPPEITVKIAGKDITNLEFTAKSSAAGPYSITGTIRKNMTRQPLAGVTVILAGAASATAVTDSSGMYSFEDLAQGKYTVRPTLEGYKFAPAVRNINITNKSVMADFNAIMRISEIIREIIDLLSR